MVDLAGRELGEELRGVERRETIIRTYFVMIKKNLFAIKGQETEAPPQCVILFCFLIFIRN